MRLIIAFGLGCCLWSGDVAHACSIVAYIGNRLCAAMVLDGLQRLEYRGYDSAGIAWVDQTTQQLTCVKAVGRLQQLRQSLAAYDTNSCAMIGHTRWATHGKANELNAHPHVDCNRQIAVVHNGIIENFSLLKEQLISKGHAFRSATDTEVIAHVLEDACAHFGTDLKSAVLASVDQLEGAYGFVALAQSVPDTLIVVRKGSPVCIGMNEHEKFVASDVLACASYASHVIYLPEKSCALVQRDNVHIFDFHGVPLSVPVQPITVSAQHCEKNGFDHFMLKEIYEQRSAIALSVNYYKSIRAIFDQQTNLSAEFIKKLRRVHIIACGTSWHAGCIAQFFFEQVCGVSTNVYLASEFRYKTILSEPDSLYILISQSGETADTLEALRQLNSLNLPTLAITNVASSTMAREAKGCLLTFAGPEIAVASTKSFTAQLSALYWVSQYVAWKKHMITLEQFKQAEEALLDAAQGLDDAVHTYDRSLADKIRDYYAHYNHFFFLGRHTGYPMAMEAALKLKEIAYVFASGYSAGELKHGAIALIDAKVPVIMISCLNPVIYQKLLANAHEVKARNGHLMAITFEGQRELIELADYAVVLKPVSELLTPIVLSGVVQLFAYHMAQQLGCDIDKPRNLAKSVTVE